MKILLFLILFLLTNSCSSQPKSTRDYDFIENQIYAEYSDGKKLGADIYVPKKAGLHPAVVVVHGGGWTRRTREDMNDISQKLALKGYVVMNISYRLAPENVFPSCIVDYLKAVQWLKSNAKKWDIDTSRIGSLGYSAGAHIVSLGALLQENNQEHAKIFGKENIKNTKIKAVVAGGTPTDLTRFSDSELVIKFLGKKFEEDPGLYEKASPVFYVHRKAPRFFLYHGENDWIVDRAQMTLFEIALKKESVFVETYEVPVIGHVATFLWSGESVNKAIGFFNKNL